MDGKFCYSLQYEDRQTSFYLTLKFELGKVLRILSGALKDWVTSGGDGRVNAAITKIEACKLVDEAIDIFTQVWLSMTVVSSDRETSQNHIYIKPHRVNDSGISCDLNVLPQDILNILCMLYYNEIASVTRWRITSYML